MKIFKVTLVAFITLVAFMLSLCILNSAFAERSYYKELTGSLFIWGTPDHSLKPNDELEGFTIWIGGEGAKALYNQMNDKEYYNECYDDGTLTKYKDSIECHKTQKNSYSCGLGINLIDQKVYSPESC